MNNQPIPTGKTYTINGFTFVQVSVEPCSRLMQLMKGQEMTCACSSCSLRRANNDPYLGVLRG